ncbi:hypothetical protein HPB52_015449 [Rhipicephalus sanguineus]|uniref:Uncharacterized protein n=1 Tax=Rhipicephalus sanguineus TaxID=34632 RepID=A0A9D4SP33_RHISA|nr:hypothetical protein HPB52_015449 [Rhipicephalus sanguineus]
MVATEVVDASGEAAGGIKEDEKFTIEPVPSSHNSAAKSTSEDTTDENAVSQHVLENPQEKPPDDEDEEAMDSSQTRKCPAPESDEARAGASDAAEQTPSCGERVVSFGGGRPRRLCQRSQEGATKKCKGESSGPPE